MPVRNSGNVRTSSLPLQRLTPRRHRRKPATACRLNAQGRSVWSWLRETPEFEAAPPGLAILDPCAGELQWLEFELAIAAYGRPGGFVDLDEATVRLGPDGARRLIARAAAICARRGVGLLVETRQSPADCVMRRECGARPPCLKGAPGRTRPLAPPARIG